MAHPRPLATLLLLFLLNGSLAAQTAPTDEERYTAWVEQGYDYIERACPDSALLCFSSALQLLPQAPTNYMLHSNIAEIHIALRDTLQALASMHQAVLLQPNLPSLRERRAEVLAHMGREQEALLDYDYIVATHPTRERSLFNRALLKKEMGLYEGAISDLEVIVSNNDKAYLPRILLAQVQQLRGEGLVAERILNFLISSYPAIPVAYRERARLYIADGRKSLAMRDVREVMKMRDKVTYEDYLLRGEIWLLYGEKREAQRDFAKALEMGAPSVPQIK